MQGTHFAGIALRDNKDVRRIVEVCDGLDDDNPDQRDVKKHLTQFLLIKVCGIYENEIDEIIRERASRSCDAEVVSFILNTVSAYKHLKLDSLKGNVVGKFSSERKKEFIERVDGSRAEAAYNSIVGARNAVAHGSNITMTFDEFKKKSRDADGVLADLAAVLAKD